jgi:hypothetical protein
VAATPAGSKTGPAETVNVASTATAGLKRQKMASAHPKKAAKSTLAASRVSKRAALLAKKRTMATTSADAAVNVNDDGAAADDEAPPEALRGAKGRTSLSSLDLSLGASLPTPSTPPPPSCIESTPTPPPPPPLVKTCMCVDPDCEICTVECEADFFDEKYEEGEYRLNTRKPDWAWVFRCKDGICRFCKKPLDDDDDGDENCAECGNTSVFQLVLKYAPRWQYFRR